MKPKASLRHFLALAGCSMMAVSSSSAAIVTWDGDISTTWATAGNWDTLPTNDLTTDIANFNLTTYGGNPVFAPTVDATTSIAGITIGASNSAMTLTTGGFLSIGASGVSIANGAGAFTISGSTTLGAAQTWTNNSANNFTFGAVSNGTNLLTIGGSGNAIATGDIGSGSSSGGLTKQGAGRLTLQAASTRTGATVIDGGTLRIENATAFGTTAAAITINNGGTFELGTSTAIANGTGTINLNNGGTILNGLAGAEARIDKTIAVQNSASSVVTFNSGTNASNVLVINGGNNTRLTGGATGAKLQIAGSGVVRVGEVGQGRTASVTGDWYLQSGQFAVRADGSLGALANDIYFEGGTLSNGGAATTISSARVLNFNHASGGTVDTGGGNFTLGTAGQLNGSNQLTKAGANSLIISAANTGFSGNVLINAGTVSFANNGLGNGSATITLAGGTLQWAAAANTQDIGSRLRTSGANTLNLDVNNNAVVFASALTAANIAGSGGLTLTSSTAGGSLTLAGANTYTGTTTVTQSILSLDFTDGSNRINSGNALTLNGGTLQFTNLGTNTQTFGTITLNSATASSITRSGTWTSGVSDLGTLSGSGTLDVSNLTGSPSWIMASGNASQTYLLNGQVTANSGTSFVRTDASGNLLTVTTSDFANNATIGNNAGTSIRLVAGGSTGTGATVSGFVGLSTAGTTDFDSILNRYTTGTVTIDVTNSGINASNILRLGSYGLMFSSSGAALTIGTDVANGGVLTAGGADNTAGTIYVSGSNNTTINSAIQNNGTGVVGLNKDGSGILTIAGANTYTGGTTINAGTLLATTTSTSLTPQSPLGTGTITLNGTGTILQLRASGTLNTTAETIQFNNNVTVGGNATINVDRPGATSTTKTIQLGTLNIGANTLGVTGGNSYALRFNGATTLTGNATFDVANIYNNNPSLILAGAVGDGSADYSLTKTGAGMLALSGTNTFSGGVFINAGTLQVTSAANLGDSANVVTFTGNSTFTFGANTTLSQGIAINPGVTGTIYGYDKTAATINNSLSGSGTLLVYGGGVNGINLTFTSTNNTFSGDIIIRGDSGSYAGSLTMNSLADTPGSRIKTGVASAAIFNYGAGSVAPLVLSNRQIEINSGPAVLNNNATNVNSTVTVNTNLLVTVNGNTSLTLGGSNTGNNTFAGVIGNKTGYVTSLTKAGAGTWILSNTNNSYTGVTTVSGGILVLGSANALPGGIGTTGGTSALTFNGGVIGLGSGDFTRGLAAAGTVTGVNFTGAGGWAAYSADRLVNLGGASSTITWATANTGFNGQTLILGAATATHKVTLQNGLDLTTAARTVRVDDGSATVDAELSGVITGGVGGALTKTGVGTLLLSNANTYTGLTTVNGGSLQLGINSAIQAGNSVTVNSTTAATTATLDLNGYSASLANLTFGGTSATATSANQVIGTGAGSVLTLTGTTTAVTYTNTNNPLGATISATTVDLNGATQTFTIGDSTSTANELTVSSAIQNGALTKAGAGTMTLTGTSNYASGTSVTAGTLALTGSLTGGGAISTSGAGSVFNQSTTGVISGASTFTQNSSAAKSLLYGLNTYTGKTTISQGILEINSIGDVNGGASSLGAPTTVANGTIDMGATTTLGQLIYVGAAATTDRVINLAGTTGGATIVNLGTGALKLTSDFTATGAGAKTVNLTGHSDIEIAGAIVDNSGTNFTSVSRYGIARTIFSGANSYTGTTSASGGGSLVLDYTNDSSKLSDTRGLTLGGITTTYSGGGTLTLKGASSAHIEVVSATTLGAGATSLTRDGANTAKLRMNAITRQAGGTISFGDATIADTDTTNTNGILGGYATIGSDWAVNSTNGGDGAITALASYTGTLPSSGAGASTANYTLTGGGLQTSTVAANTLKITGSGVTDNTLDLAGNTLTITSTSATAVGGILYTGGGTGTYNITGTTAGNGINASGAFDLIINTVTGNLNISAEINGSNGARNLVKSGAGNLAISSANAFTGVTYVNQGALQLRSNTAAGTATNTANAGIIVQNGAALELANSVVIGAEALTLTGTGITDAGALRNVASNTSSYAGAITIGLGGARINSDASGALTLSGGITSGLGTSVTFGGDGTTTATTTAITGVGQLIKDGAGTLNLNFANTYTGGTTLSGGTTSFVNNGLSTSGNVTFTGNSTLQWGSSNTQDLSSRIVMSNGVTSTIDTGANLVSFASGVGSSSSGALTKTGNGTLTLTGTNTYSGATTISGGSIALTGTGSIASSSSITINSSTSLNVAGLTGNFTVGTSQSLGGSGTLTATDKTVIASGTLTPGNSPGTLTQDGGTLQLAVGGDLNWQVYDANGPAGVGGYDTVSLINGATLDLSALSAGNTYNINLWSLSSIGPDVNGNAINFNNTLNYAWTLFSTDSVISGFNTNLFTINTGAFNGTSGFSNTLNGSFSLGLADGGTDLVLTYTAVPEPGVALLGCLGILLIFRRRR